MAEEKVGVWGKRGKYNDKERGMMPYGSTKAAGCQESVGIGSTSRLAFTCVARSCLGASRVPDLRTWNGDNYPQGTVLKPYLFSPGGGKLISYFYGENMNQYRNAF